MISEQVYKRAQVVLSAAQERSHELSEFEVDFVDSLTERLERYDLNANISERQIDILRQIAQKLEV